MCKNRQSKWNAKCHISSKNPKFEFQMQQINLINLFITDWNMYENHKANMYKKWCKFISFLLKSAANCSNNDEYLEVAALFSKDLSAIEEII
jgi:hypothetical protein